MKTAKGTKKKLLEMASMALIVESPEVLPANRSHAIMPCLMH
jgi:hypothetical protein